MNTEQSYVGRGTIATTSSQTAQIEANTPYFTDGQPNLIIDPRAFLLQTRLVDLADKFVSAGFDMGPMQAIGNLLTHWQCAPITELSVDAEGYQMHCALLLADFLDELLNANTAEVGEGQAHA